MSRLAVRDIGRDRRALLVTAPERLVGTMTWPLFLLYLSTISAIRQYSFCSAIDNDYSVMGGCSRPARNMASVALSTCLIARSPSSAEPFHDCI